MDRARTHRHRPARKRVDGRVRPAGATGLKSPSSTPASGTLRRCQEPFTFPLAVARWKKNDELFWRYAFVAHDQSRTDAEAILARHRLKGGKEQLFKEVLRGLDLHHPPCESLTANRMFYAIAALAYNLMKAVQLLCLPEECQSWQLKTLLRQVLLMPAKLVKHARVLIARVQVPAAWLCWWRTVMSRLWLEPQVRAIFQIVISLRFDAADRSSVFSCNPKHHQINPGSAF